MFDLVQTYDIYYLVGQYPDGLLDDLTLTFLLASVSLMFTLPAGIILGLRRVSPIIALRWSVTALVHVVRSMSLLMMIFWAYFLLPSVAGQHTDQFSTILATLVIFDGAYLAEIVRVGIQGLSRRQMESVRSLGLSYMQAVRHVILPQVLCNVLPSLINQLVSTIRETLLGYITSLPEASFVVGQTNTVVMIKSTEVYGLLGISYFIMCSSLTRAALYLKRHSAARTPPKP